MARSDRLEMSGPARRSCPPERLAGLSCPWPPSGAGDAVLLEANRKPLEVLARQVTLSASVGLAFAPEHGTGLDELVHVADTRMCQASSAGGNRVVG